MKPAMLQEAKPSNEIVPATKICNMERPEMDYYMQDAIPTSGNKN